MSVLARGDAQDLEARVRQSRGASEAAIYAMVAEELDRRDPGAGVVVDVGCGSGNLWPFIRHRFSRYVGVDAVCYEGFPSGAEFLCVDLEAERLPLPENFADTVTAVEVVEHLENPRAFMRELVRVARPGGWITITTPNQLSLLSLATLVVKRRFSAFQDVHYPAHLTALLEVDLRRIAGECGLTDVGVSYSRRGRVAFTPWHYPSGLARLFPRAMSDNLLLIGMKQRG